MQIAIADTIPQKYSDSNQTNRLKKIIPLAELAGYAVGFSFLWQSWYKNYAHSSFHWFNDNYEWLQMDKISHCNTAYWLTTANYHLLQHAGYRQSQARWMSAGSAFAAMSTIELFDGFSSAWGASWGDLIANASGVALATIQNSSNTEELLRLKISYWPSPYREIRPSLLGTNPAEGFIKDYNGQTHWLSVNMNKVGIKFSPRWLNIAIGYGATGMTGGEQNPQNTISNSSRMRSFYLSPDINWAAFHPRKKWLRMLFCSIQIIKIPAPAIELRTDGTFWWLIKF